MVHALKSYIQRNQVPIQEICSDLGITDPHLYYIMNGKRYPSRDLCLKIYNYTKGEITPMDLLDMECKGDK